GQVVDTRQHVARPLDEADPGRGEGDATARAVEEAGPDLLLQRAHVPPEGLRGDVVTLRGFPEVQFLRQRHRVAERLDVHGNASVTGDATARRGAEERVQVLRA